MKELMKENRWFLYPFLIIWFTALGFQLLCAKPDIHLFLNSYHTPLLDLFFKYYTKIGEWVPFIIILALLLFYNMRAALLLSLTEGVSALITTGLKHLFRMPRPKVFFSELGLQLPLVDGVHLHSTLSFPSGHTTAFFALFMTLALFTKNNTLKLTYLLAAVLGAFSRIYLSQHFLEDTLAGSSIAVLTVILIAPYIESKNTGNYSLVHYISQRYHKK